MRQSGGPTGQGVEMKPADMGTWMIGPTIAYHVIFSDGFHRQSPCVLLPLGKSGTVRGDKLNTIVDPHFRKRFRVHPSLRRDGFRHFGSELNGACPWDDLVG